MVGRSFHITLMILGFSLALLLQGCAQTPPLKRLQAQLASAPEYAITLEDMQEEGTFFLRRVVDLGDGWQPGLVPLEKLQEQMVQLRELMQQKGRDFSSLAISLLSSASDIMQNPERLSQLSELGVGETVLFFSGADAQGTISQLEDFARTIMK